MPTQVMPEAPRPRMPVGLAPAAMSAAAVGLALLALELDRAGPRGVPWLGAGAREVLQAVAIVTAVAVAAVLCAGLVVLAAASRHLVPALAREVLGDRITELVLGVCAATLLFCLVALRGLEAGFAPRVAATLAIGLAAASGVALMALLRHVARSASPDGAVDRIGKRLEIACARDAGAHGSAALPIGFDAGARTIRATVAGYVCAGDLVPLARARDLVIEILVRPRDFVVPGVPLLRVYPAVRCDDAVAGELVRALGTSAHREADRDPRSALEELAQVGARALSRGDTITACAAVDRAVAFLARAARREPPPQALHDEEGRLRVLVRTTTYEELFELALDPIREQAGPRARVLRHLLESVAKLAPSLATTRRRRVATALVDRIARAARAELPPADWESLEPLAARVRAQLAVVPREGGASATRRERIHAAARRALTL